ncbi:hypothetical protein HKD37_01G000555 [Glycine soja]
MFSEGTQSSESSSAFPNLRESEVDASEAHIMAEDQPRRVTLKDYSTSTSKQLLDASTRGKIKLKTPEEAIELIENMAASDHAILRDRTHVPTKRSLLELSSQDALLAQNKLLAKQLESLTKTLSKLPTQLQVTQPSHSAVMQVGGCSIYGGSHESGCCIPLEDAAKEVNYMGNQHIPRFNVGGFSGQWRSHPGNQFNKDQGGPSNRCQNQGPNLYERTTKVEETLAKFMQVSMSNHKSTKSAIKNLEIQVGQLAKQIAENSSGECKALITRSKKVTMVEDEGRSSDKREKKINDEEKEEKEEKNEEKKEKKRKKRRQRVSWLEKRRRRLFHVQGRKHHIPWCRLRRKRNDTLLKLEITIPFGKALQQMPLYSNSLKIC